MDTHKCGDCQKEFHSYEDFLIHKLLIEQYKLTLEISLKIPSLRLPKFVKVNNPPKAVSVNNENSVDKSPGEAASETCDVEEPQVTGSTPLQYSPLEAAYSPAVEVVVDSEEVVSDNVSVGSQPESLRIDEGEGAKEMSSPLSDSTSEVESGMKTECYCKYCKRFYKNRVVLRVHRETVHGGARPFVCSACNRAFKTKGSLVRHVRTHTGERPFACVTCRKTFLDSGSLARHVHRIHRKRPFKQASDVKVVITRLEVDSQDIDVM